MDSAGEDPDQDIGGGGRFLRAHKINRPNLEIITKKIESGTSNYMFLL